MGLLRMWLYDHIINHWMPNKRGGWNVLFFLTLGIGAVLVAALLIRNGSQDARWEKEALQALELDFHLLSLHLVNGVDPYYSDKYFGGKTRNQAYREYAEAKAESILAWEDFDSVAHIGYASKFSIYTGPERALVYADAPDVFDEILRHIIRLGKCLEVNTSGFATTGDTFAHSSIIKRYIELGGENFTFGSDSHAVDRDYDGIERAKDMVRDLGGKYQASFDQRRMTLWRI